MASRVYRFTPIRKFRFCRSTSDVLMYFCFGLPLISIFFAVMQTGELYFLRSGRPDARQAADRIGDFRPPRPDVEATSGGGHRTGGAGSRSSSGILKRPLYEDTRRYSEPGAHLGPRPTE